MLVLITYDVNTADKEGCKRLRKVAKRVQNSVFECQLDATQCHIVKEILKEIIDEQKDNLRFYYLGSNYKNKIEHIGTEKTFDVKDPLIF